MRRVAVLEPMKRKHLANEAYRASLFVGQALGSRTPALFLLCRLAPGGPSALRPRPLLEH